MSSKIDSFSKMEIDCAKNFNFLIKGTNAKQIILLRELLTIKNLSKHLESRKKCRKDSSKKSNQINRSKSRDNSWIWKCII